MTSRQQSLLSAFGLLVFQALPSNLVLLPPVPLDPPLRAGDRVFLYPSQIQKRLTYKPFSAGRVTLTDLHLGLWVFDANSAEPLFRWRRPPPPKPPPPLPPAPADSFRSRGRSPLLCDKRTFQDLESVSPRRLWSPLRPLRS